MPVAPAIVSHSSATATDALTITIPAPAGLQAHHVLLVYLVAVLEHSFPPVGQVQGWLPNWSTLQSVGVGSPDNGLGQYFAITYMLKHANVPAASYTFTMQSTAGFGGSPPANGTTFSVAHGHLLAIEAGIGDIVIAGSDSAIAFTQDLDFDFGLGPNLAEPPSLLLNFLADATGPSAAFGTVLIDDGFGMIGVYDTTGLAEGDNLGPRTVSDDLGQETIFWGQLELIQGATLNQTKVRGRNDDGGEISATWKQPANVGWQQQYGENFRVRFSIDETSDRDPLPRTLVPQVLGSDGWTDVTVLSSVVRLSDSPNVVDGVATTQQLGAALNGGAFVPGKFRELSGGVATDLGVGGKVEHEWCMTVDFFTPAILANPPGGSMVVPFAPAFTAVPLPPNTDVNGVLENTDPTYGPRGQPTDFLKVVVTGAGVCEFLNTVGTFDTYGYLYDNTGTLVNSDDDSAGGNRWVFNGQLNVGTYWIGMSAWASGRGPWTVRARPNAPDAVIAPGTVLHFRLVDHFGSGSLLEVYDGDAPMTMIVEGGTTTYFVKSGSSTVLFTEKGAKTRTVNKKGVGFAGGEWFGGEELGIETLGSPFVFGAEMIAEPPDA